MLGKILDTVIGGMIRNVPGGIGQRLRSAYWRRRLGACGRRVKIEEGVVFNFPEQIEIGENVWIGMNSTILSEVGRIGSNSIVAAGSIVTREVPPNCIVGGIPAKFIKSIKSDG